MQRLGILISIVFALSWHQKAEAYPEFIAYGYNACMTCHFNGMGGGPLNDYGRALLSGEISSRLFYSKKTSDDDIAGRSGFAGSKELPSWLRPHIKYRGLYLRQDPAPGNNTSEYHQMQEDVGLTVPIDKKGKYLVSFTYGLVSPPGEYGNRDQAFGKNMQAREYWARVEVAKKTWLYAGLMEKVYGIRRPDHESFQRRLQGFQQNPRDEYGFAESQGLILQKSEAKWDAGLNYFIGNPYVEPDYKETGVSGTYEYEIGERKRLGGSIMQSKNAKRAKNLYGIHYRQGMSKGSAFMAEYGIIQDMPPGDSKTGSYNLVEGYLDLARGYNLVTVVERYNQEFKQSAGDTWNYQVGVMAFPFPRLELRVDAINTRGFSSAGAKNDSWMLEGQVHVSL